MKNIFFVALLASLPMTSFAYDNYGLSPESSVQTPAGPRVVVVKDQNRSRFGKKTVLGIRNSPHAGYRFSFKNSRLAIGLENVRVYIEPAVTKDSLDNRRIGRSSAIDFCEAMGFDSVHSLKGDSKQRVNNFNGTRWRKQKERALRLVRCDYYDTEIASEQQEQPDGRRYFGPAIAAENFRSAKEFSVYDSVFGEPHWDNKNNRHYQYSQKYTNPSKFGEGTRRLDYKNDPVSRSLDEPGHYLYIKYDKRSAKAFCGENEFAPRSVEMIVEENKPNEARRVWAYVGDRWPNGRWRKTSADSYIGAIRCGTHK